MPQRAAILALVALVLASCATQSPAVTPTPPPAAAAPSPAERDCSAPTILTHQAPELEALLPTRSQGRTLPIWSVRGRCWMELAGVPAEDIDAFVASAESASDGHTIDVDGLRYAVAGRSDTKADPPYFVFAASRSDDDDEITLAMVLLFGGGGFVDPYNALDLKLYEERTVGGKVVYVGETTTLHQTEHQRGRPYLYQTDDVMFLVLTEDDSWAADAISQLP